MNLLRRVWAKAQLVIPINRVIAFGGPYFAHAGSLLAAWLVAKVNVLGIPGLDQADLATFIAAALTYLAGMTLHALGGWQWLKGNHIVLQAQLDDNHLLPPAGVPTPPTGGQGPRA